MQAGFSASRMTKTFHGPYGRVFFKSQHFPQSVMALLQKPDKVSDCVFCAIELKTNKETSFLDICAALPVSILPYIVSEGDNP